MWDVLIVILIVAAAAGAVAWRIYRRLSGKGGCSCCQKRPTCPFADEGPDSREG